MDSLLDACPDHHRRCSHFPSKHHPPPKPSTNQTHKPRKIIKPTKKQTQKFKTNQHPHGKTNPGQRDCDQHQPICECPDPTTELRVW